MAPQPFGEGSDFVVELLVSVCMIVVFQRNQIRGSMDLFREKCRKVLGSVDDGHGLEFSKGGAD